MESTVTAVDLGLFVKCVGGALGLIASVLGVIVLWRKVNTPNTPPDAAMEYITRGEHDADMAEVRNKIDSMNDKLSNIAGDVRELVGAMRAGNKKANES